MPVHALRHPEVYLEFEELPPACRPCWVVREQGAVLLRIDPRATCLQASEWIVRHLTPAEANAIRAAYGVGPVGEHVPVEWLSDEMVPTFVPDSLRLRLPAELESA